MDKRSAGPPAKKLKQTLLSCSKEAQPVGAPEISKKSVIQGSVNGGEEMFIIGKNFMKGTVVVFEDVDNDRVVWSAEAEIDQDFFQATHLVCRIPPYHPADATPLRQTKEVQVVVHSNGRSSEPVAFHYVPDGLSLKRPYDPSSQEDLGHVAKTAAVEVVKGDDDNEPQTLDLRASPDNHISGLTLETTQLPITSNLIEDADTEMQRPISQASLLLNHFVDSNLGVDTSIPASAPLDNNEHTPPTRSVPYPSPPQHGQGPGGGILVGDHLENASFMEQSSVTTVPIVRDVRMECVSVPTSASRLIMDELASNSNINSASQAKRPASFVSNDLPVNMMMHLVSVGDVSKPVSNEKMHWVPIGIHPVVEEHLGLVNETQLSNDLPAESYALPPKQDPDVTHLNNEVVFNFSHGLVFSHHFPSSVDGRFSEEPPMRNISVSSNMSIDNLQIPNVGLTSVSQNMETSITSDNHADHLLSIAAVSFGGQQIVESVGERPATAMNLTQSETVSHDQGVFLSNKDIQSITGMDISGSLVHPAQSAIHDMTPRFPSSDSPCFKSSHNTFNITLDQLHGFINDRSKVDMKIQIAGMNLPQRMVSPLNIVTLPLTDTGSIQQSLAELIDLQNQFASSANTSAGSLPQSPPYQLLSVPQHDVRASHDLTCESSALWQVDNSANAWTSDNVFNKSLNAHDNQLPNYQGQTSGSECILPRLSVANPVSENFVHAFQGDNLDNDRELLKLASPILSKSAGNSSFTHSTPSNDLTWSSVLQQQTNYAPMPSSDTTFLNCGHTEIVEQGNALNGEHLLKIIMKNGGVWNSTVDVVQGKDEINNEKTFTAYECDALPRSCIQGPVGNMFLVGSTQTPVSVDHQIPLSAEDLPISAHISMPLILVTNLHSQDLATAHDLNVSGSSAIDSAGVGCHVEHGSVSLNLSPPEYHTSSVEAESSKKVPILLYKLLSEDAEQQSSQMTPSTARHSLPDLSFDDTHYVSLSFSCRPTYYSTKQTTSGIV